MFFVDEVSKNVKELKGFGVKFLPVHDSKIVEFASNLMMNPLVGYFNVLVLGNKKGIDYVCDKANSLGLRSYVINLKNF